VRLSKEPAYGKFHSLLNRAKKCGVVLPFGRGQFFSWFEVHKDDPCGCNAMATQIDHVIPIARGGNHDLDNLQMLCAPCNMKKWSWLDGEERMWPWEIPGAKKHTGPKKAHRPKSIKIGSNKRKFGPGDIMWIGGRMYIYPFIQDIL
jgi:hypothetical protein